ncbi:hypothetical protein [Vibrio salinus]|uniref:hypothetical protein n=1 Tax=Vibrio salinus TaxID=2899784 RepID=UPI001E56DE86|nr:hypothetical protein [Vibrio salinus]MCE0493780.1 hypothetical protein [Vibrio salinus]
MFKHTIYKRELTINLSKPHKDNSKICSATSTIEAKNKCTDGDVAMFLPNTYGNEQVPLLYVTLFCDFDYPITHAGGGVSCIFTTKRKDDWKKFGVK